MDIIFQYPPELFQLLVDTIPLLCRSKRDVLLFFQGAGVERKSINDLLLRVEQDRESINKYDIARTVLSRLNGAGETTLRERREVLKRIVEFEDFSTCWPNDQLKAKGLVAEIRRVVNVKDAFTRMHQERESERQRRQEKEKARLAIQLQKQAELDSIKSELFALFGMPSSQNQKRGKMLEGILNRLFKAYDILVREAFEHREGQEGVVEQIDGLVDLNGYPYLVEMKWWSEPLGKGDVSPHLVNVYSRGHAGGILISASGFTQPAVTVCKEALAHKMIILCELEEFVILLEQQQNLLELLKRKIDHAVAEKHPLFKPFSR